MSHAPAAAPQHPPSFAFVGYMLIALVLLSAIVLLHHPVAHGHDPAAIISSIQRQARTDYVIHGAMAFIFGLLTATMYLFASTLGWLRFPVLLGLVAYSCGFILIVLAVLTDGFAVPAIASACGGDGSQACTANTILLLRLSSIQIELYTRFALFAIAVAILAWGLALMAAPTVRRWAGGIAITLGALQLLGLFLVASRFTPQSLLIVSSAQFAWYILVAVLLIGKSPGKGTGIAGESP